MATTPYFLWPAQSSSAAASDLMAGFGFSSAQEDTPALAATAAMDMAPLHAPELSEAVARPRLRRQASSSGSGRQQGATAGGTPKKPPQRGLGVAELERLRCGGVDPLQDLNVAAAAAMLEAVAANANAQGNPALLHHQDHLPAFDAATGARYYSPLLVQPPPAPPAHVRYVHGTAPEQQYFVDRWGCVGSFLPAGNAGAVGAHLQQLQAQLQAHAQAPAPEQPSSQNTIWRPAPSSASSCVHAGHRCDLCSKTVRAMPERAPRAPAPAAPATTTTMQDYSIYDLAAAMTAASKETAADGYLAREAKKEVREIEFFPTSAASHAAESEFATAMRWTTPFPSATPSVGGYAAPLDLSLRL
ncbi:uncharacterized protein LOC124648468 [Lolium rigidum]|uniref:uncharacterized protein LOC124648468 n=1 Tax=Lolium rigidum TaxID=89674 RepID=UPI001F5CFFF8|nr:uncharacterized protein LOC124648468 [Lolium rigidum]